MPLDLTVLIGKTGRTEQFVPQEEEGASSSAAFEQCSP